MSESVIMFSKAWIYSFPLLLCLTYSSPAIGQASTDSLYQLYIEEALQCGTEGQFQAASLALNTALSTDGISRADSVYVYLLHGHIAMHLENNDSLRKYVSTFVPLSLRSNLLSDPRVIQAIRDASTFYGILNLNKKILPLYENALSLAARLDLPERHRAIAGLLNGRYLVYGRKGEWERAYEDCKRVIDLKTEEYSPMSPELADNYSDMANICQSLHRTSEAIEYFKRAIDIYHSMDPVPHRSIGLVENNLAYLYASLHLQDLAYIHYNKAYESWVNKAHDSSRLSTIYLNIAKSLKAIGHLQKGRYYSRHALDIMKERNKGINSIASALIVLARNTEDSLKKLHLYFRVDSLLEHNSMNGRLRIVIHGDLGNFYFKQLPDEIKTHYSEEELRLFDESSSHFMMALAFSQEKTELYEINILRNKLFQGKNIHTLQQIKDLLPELRNNYDGDLYRLGLYTIGKFYKWSEKYDSSLVYYNRMITTLPGIVHENTYLPRIIASENIPLNKNNQKLIYDYSDFLWQLYKVGAFSETRYDEVLSFAQASQKLCEKYLRFSRSLQNESWNLFKNSTDLLLKIVQRYPGTENDYKCLKAIHRYHSTLLIKPLIGMDITRAESTTSIDSLHKLRGVMAEIYTVSRRLLKETDTLTIKKLKARKLSLFHRYHSLQSEIQEAFRVMYATGGLLSVSEEEFKENLAQKNLQFIYAYQGDSASYIISAGEKQIKCNVVPGSPEDVFHKFLKSIINHEFIIKFPHEADSLFNATAFKLYNKYFKYSLETLSDEYPIGYISQGLWQNLPVHLLINQSAQGETWKNKAYLFKYNAIYYSFGLRNILGSRENTDVDNKRQYAIFGWDNHFTSGLNYVNKEVKLIHRLTDADIYRDSEATIENFLKKAPAYDIVHIATHGVLMLDSSRESYLSFYPDSTFQGKLDIGQIYHSFLPIDLLVLSACNTGYEIDETVPLYSSINRAFYYSGVNSSIVSLWSVPDKSTADFMRILYTHLNKTSPLSAIQKTYTEMLENSSRFKSNPWYWGGFIYYGPPELASENSFFMKIGLWVFPVAGLIFLLVTIFAISKFLGSKNPAKHS